MANALLDETKTSQVTVTFPWRGNVRLQPTVEAILDEARPATLGKGDQLIHGALKTALIEAIVADRWQWVYRTLGRLLGADPPFGGPPPIREIETDRKPLTKAAAR